MSDTIVCKFGGSSVANAEQIKKVGGIVANDRRRRFVVVSAPGRSGAREEKVTDHLLNIATGGVHFREQRKPISAADSKRAVLSKYSEIGEELGIDASPILRGLEGDMQSRLEGDKRVAFLASRGEHYSASVIAQYFRSQGIETRVCLPEDIGLLVSDQFLDARVLDESYGNIASLQDQDGVTVIPGFYGVTSGGDIAVFSRGGSDLTGGEIAYAIGARTYENWTDVSGVFEADPTVVPEARVIPRLTFKEIRLLSARGFNVFHLNAMLKCKQRKIPIHIRNTNRPADAGTLILNERVPEEGVVGIARLDNMAYIYLEKDMLGEEIGFTAGLLTIFREFGINTYHYPTDKDDIAVLVNQDDLQGAINDLRREISKRLQPDAMEVFYNLSILTPVGLGLRGNSYPIVSSLNALGEQHITIEMLHQSPTKICFHIGVAQAVADDALRTLYRVLLEGTRT